jgi:TolA-binding protein
MRSLLIGTALAGALLPAAAGAQSLDARVDRLESEMRAVQRKVFPGGAGQLIQPQIQPEAPDQAAAPGVPASSPLADLSQRVTSLEGQIASLTGQTEQNGYRVRQLEEAFAAYKRATDARLKALEDRAAAAPVGIAPPADDEPVAATPARPAAGKPAAAATAPADPSRAGRLAAVARQDTGDAAEDGYLYGYRLWEAKLYPEAQAQLKKVVETYPKHRRASYAQNLLGRAYLDDGKPSLASMAFYDNYKKLPDGERAPDSLYYLAQALQTLKKPADACKVYGELSDVYGAKIGAQMKANIAKGRTAAKCG